MKRELLQYVQDVMLDVRLKTSTETKKERESGKKRDSYKLFEILMSPEIFGGGCEKSYKVISSRAKQDKHRSLCQHLDIFRWK